MIKVGPKSNNGCPHKEREIWRQRDREETHREEVPVKMEAEIGLMMPQAKKHQGFLGTTRSQGRGMEHILPIAPRRNRPCGHLDFGLLASRPVKEYISPVLSLPVCGTLLQQS